MTILQWVDNNHHWNENKMTWNVNLFTYSSEELQPNSQGYISKKVTHFFLTLQVLRQEGFIQWKFLHLCIIDNLHWEEAFCWTHD